MASDSDSRPTPELERPQITGDLKFNAVSGNRETNDHKKADFTSDDSTSDALEKQYAIITWDGPDDKDNPMNMSNLRKWAVTLIVSISGLNLVTIYTIPAELHGASAAVLQTAIRDSVRDGLLRHNKQELLRRIIPIGESTISSTDVLGEGSTKTPDGGFRYNDPSTGRQELALIIETGVSGTYQQLRADINVWLSHIHCRAAILLWFKESPSFKNPTNAVAYSRDHSLGPYRYKDHDWCGRVAEAFIEVFNSDSDNEEPVRYLIAQNGLIVVQDHSLDTGLILGDLFPSDDEVGAAQTEPICLDMAFLQGAIESAARATATTRFSHFFMAN